MTRLSHRSNIRWLVLTLLLAAPELVSASDRLHPKVLAAFREVVSTPAKSTVQVYCDGYRSALGAIVEPNGYIVTKASELKGRIECQLLDGRKLPATVVGSDPTTDLAVMKIDAKDLPVVQWNETEVPAVGTWVVTPGLSRDPLAIGVLSVGVRRIPAPSAALGIVLHDSENVARILELVPDGAAEKAGLKQDDIILEVNGKKVLGRQNLQETIKSKLPGEKVELLIRRGDKDQTLSVVLGSFSQLVHGDRAEFQNTIGGNALSERRAGFPAVIQHDSILRPAECGGPLVDIDGKVVGINIARAGRVESFALTAKVVRDSIKRLLETQLTSTPAETPK